tara:strand:+ start:272 stop:1351 length:1080 start_codon:yes stop_codon:yes gene_type:complete
MNKINIYLFNLTIKYLIINFIIVSIFIIFINLLEISRVISEDNNKLINYFYLSFLKYPNILNEILPFVTILSVAFLIRNLINNNELVSMRNLGYSIFDIFAPISFAVFCMGLLFLILLNPLAVLMESKYNFEVGRNDQGLYSIKVSDNEMWIKNEIDDLNSSFINIKNIDLKDMNAKNIKILLIKDNSNKFLLAEKGKFKNNLFLLENVKYYNLNTEDYKILEKFNLAINFNKDNIVNAISRYKLVPFYEYFEHSRTLSKFNLYSPEIGLYYLSEILKPVFIVVLAFVIVGFTSQFQRNENFFKILFIAISLGFFIFLLKEIISKLTINLSINFYLSYLIIILVPFFIGLYQIIKIEND